MRVAEKAETMKELIEQRLYDSIQVKEETLKSSLKVIIRMAQEIIKAFKRKNKLILFGNGGSAADSQHIAAEFIGRFQRKRRSLPAIALTTDTSALTALGNDYGFDVIFARQLEGIGKAGDVAIAFSTSGNSKNVIEAVRKARTMGIKTLAFTGCKGGRLARLCDLSLIVPSDNTARIQETHICVAHIICEIVEGAVSK